MTLNNFSSGLNFEQKLRIKPKMISTGNEIKKQQAPFALQFALSPPSSSHLNLIYFATEIQSLFVRFVSARISENNLIDADWKRKLHLFTNKSPRAPRKARPINQSIIRVLFGRFSAVQLKLNSGFCEREPQRYSKLDNEFVLFCWFSFFTASSFNKLKLFSFFFSVSRRKCNLNFLLRDLIRGDIKNLNK